MILTHLDTAPEPDLFAPEPDCAVSRARVTDALDSMNARYGLNTVYLGSIHEVRRQAPTRIPYQHGNLEAKRSALNHASGIFVLPAKAS